MRLEKFSFAGEAQLLCNWKGSSALPMGAWQLVVFWDSVVGEILSVGFEEKLFD